MDTYLLTWAIALNASAATLRPVAAAFNYPQLDCFEPLNCYRITASYIFYLNFAPTLAT